jgi:DNA-binding response OmpR family regulator
MKILVADDDRDLVDLIRYRLHREGHTMCTSFDGESTLRAFQVEKPDLVILDLLMPKHGGMEVLEQIREQADIPILILSALRDEDHIVNALYKGADDYLIKPFGPRELSARVRALLRRTVQREDRSQKPSKPLVLGQITLDSQMRQVYVKDQKVRTTRTEFELLKHLMINHHTVVTFQDLLSNVWGYDGEQNAEVVKVTIWRLRQKLERDPDTPRYIVSVPGIGYRFQADQA